MKSGKLGAARAPWTRGPKREAGAGDVKMGKRGGWGRGRRAAAAAQAAERPGGSEGNGSARAPINYNF